MTAETSPLRATGATVRNLTAAAKHLPMQDTVDFMDAERGFVARGNERQVRAANGRVVWDLDAYRPRSSAMATSAPPPPLCPPTS